MKHCTFILILAATLGTGFLIESISGQALVTGGNAQQTREKGGFVKAMIFVHIESIVSCFNSYLSGDAATTPPCGFTVREQYGFGSNPVLQDGTGLLFHGILTQGGSSFLSIDFNARRDTDDRKSIV